jgi:hypothetical protein
MSVYSYNIKFFISLECLKTSTMRIRFAFILLHLKICQDVGSREAPAILTLWVMSCRPSWLYSSLYAYKTENAPAS